MQDEELAMTTKELFDLSGKVALITGGSRGLGLQMAEALGDMGAKVAISARKQNELDDASSYLTAKGIDVLTIVNDLGDAASRPDEQLVSSVLDRFGAVDILINNAGMVWGARRQILRPRTGAR
jgi:gluconate 5-dehydrogenase